MGSIGGFGLNVGSVTPRVDYTEDLDGPECTVCGMVEGQRWGSRRVRILEFTLARHGRASGAVRLCQRCWNAAQGQS